MSARTACVLKKSNWLSSLLRRPGTSPRLGSHLWVAVLPLSLGALPGCLDRPVCADCEPETTNQFVYRVPTRAVNKVDLLFMIDASASMADKQQHLQKAIPSLLSRFLNPLCVDERGQTIGPSNGGMCASGAPEFPPLQDIHIGVITSSLGSFGGDGCNSSSVISDDRGWLLPRARPEAQLASYEGTGFLAWDPTGRAHTPPGTDDPNELARGFANMVAAVDERGCGYEASLESWYRFLIDPEPPERVELRDLFAYPVGIDSVLLEQRERFLRPDSLVAVIMLTDENDCSVKLDGTAWLTTQQVHPLEAGRPYRMPRPTAACASNPDDPCCRSCDQKESSPPSGCGALQADPGCTPNRYYNEQEDSIHLRCFDQKRRFGVDYLEPVEKYIRGLTQRTVLDRSGKERENPLFAVRGARVPRDPSLVFLAGIVGVPWQNIATEDSLSGPGLRYLSARELVEKNRWGVILGDPATGKPPSDPHMIESIAPRSGSHPFVASGAIAPADSLNPRQDVISGHEQKNLRSEDLQYACTFELETPRDCSSAGTCDCATNADVDENRPLCQPPGGGPAGMTQYFAKAYPGIRPLEVLKGLGDQGVVASICPKLVRANTTDPSYGYNPAMNAIVASVGERLANQCLGRAPVTDAAGRLSCRVAEAQIVGGCDCTKSGRMPATEELLATVRKDLANSSACDAPGMPACTDVCACELAQSEGDALEACRNNPDPTSQQPGYCYIEPAEGIGSENLVKGCPGTKKRLLRFVGAETPTPGAIAFMTCMGAAVN